MRRKKVLQQDIETNNNRKSKCEYDKFLPITTFFPLPASLDPYSGFPDAVFRVSRSTCSKTTFVRVSVLHLKSKKGPLTVNESTHSSGVHSFLNFSVQSVGLPPILNRGMATVKSESFFE